MAGVKGNKILLSTFSKYNTGGIIGFRTQTVDNVEWVTKIWCKTCARHVDKIKHDSRLKGRVLTDIDQYVVGTSYVSKHTITRHLSSKAHMIGCDYERLLGPAVNSGASGDFLLPTSATATPTAPCQPLISETLEKQSVDAYRKLMWSAYMLATDGQSLAAFKTLIKVQKANGVKLITDCDSSDKAREFIHFIADAIRERLALILCSANAFSILSDGSQARKTSSEKELVFIRIVKGGTPVYYCVALQDMDGFGDADANNLKRSIDDVFQNEEKVAILPDQYTVQLVAATADGAAVNTGKFNGLLCQLKKDQRPWFITIHCVSHRLELAVKDSLLKDKQFFGVREFMITLYYLFKRSGKLSRHFRATADALGVHVYKFQKVHGTRFINHQRNGLDKLLANWTVLAQTIENSIENRQANINTVAKLRGILKKLQDFNFLSTCCLYKQVLDVLAKMSLKFERGDNLACEILPSVEKTADNIGSIMTEDVSLPEQLVASAAFRLEGNQQKQDLPQKGHIKRTHKEYVAVSYQPISSTQQAVDSIRLLKANALPSLKKSLELRFSSFSGEIYSHLAWIDPANWTDPKAELESLHHLASQFQIPLSHCGFEMSRVKDEWRDLRHTVKHFYRNVSAKQLWEKLFQYRRKEFPNICFLAEIVLCIGVSNSTVEAGFSHLTSMLSDRRLNLSHSTMEDLLLKKVNNLSWNETEREEIIEAALAKYLMKRRKHKIDGSSRASLGAPRKRQRLAHESDDDDESSDESNSHSDTVIDSDSDGNEF